MIELSQRIQNVKPSATLTITAKAAELRAAGRNIISLSVGEPDFDTPRHAAKAAIDAIEHGFTRYTAVGGVPELRAAIAHKFKQDNELDYDADDILVSSGGKQCIYNLLVSVMNAGDEAIIPAPYWVSYPDMVSLVEGTPVIVSTTAEHQFKITAEQLQAAITDNTRVFFINSPSNPTGMAYSREELAALGKVLRQYPKVVIATDDMYEKILFGNKAFYTFAQVNPDLKDRTITLNGVSKAFCMTGWRIGYCAGPKHIIKAMTKAQGQSTSNPCSISQKAALAALTGPTDDLQHMVQTYETRCAWLVERLNQIPGVQCMAPDGAFYVFPSIHGMIGKRDNNGTVLENDVQVCGWLLDTAGVALVPGTEFGAPNHLRISYAVAQETLDDAINRIEEAFASCS